MRAVCAGIFALTLMSAQAQAFFCLLPKSGGKPHWPRYSVIYPRAYTTRPPSIWLQQPPPQRPREPTPWYPSREAESPLITPAK